MAGREDVGGPAIVTADLGDSKQLGKPDDKGPHTAHALQPVELVVYSEPYKTAQLIPSGAVGDVAPTLLKLMGLPQPEAMTGHCLIR